MLYQTHHPVAFHFQPSATSFLLRPSERQMEMECVTSAALKTSFWKEMVPGLSHQHALPEDGWVATGVSEDFAVDDLLDFSHGGDEEEEEEEEEGKGGFVSVSSLGETGDKADSGSGLTVEEDFAAGELAVPADEVADLEWLSHFVDDSFSEFPSIAALPPPHAAPKPDADAYSETQKRRRCFLIDTQIPCKTRSKRPRVSPRERLFSHPPATPASPAATAAASPSSSVSSSSSQSSPCLIQRKPDPRKQNRGREKTECGPARRCSHCLVQKTPQWRTGPLGSKTLCNACGVRYKSGRLLPEYRPAGSPTFMSEVHSNSHRKVLEMRRKKDLEMYEPGPGPVPVQTF